MKKIVYQYGDMEISGVDDVIIPKSVLILKLKGLAGVCAKNKFGQTREFVLIQRIKIGSLY